MTNRGDCAMLCQQSHDSPMGQCEQLLTDKGEAKFAPKFVELEERACKQAIHELYMEPLTLWRQAWLLLEVMLILFWIWLSILWGSVQSFVTTAFHWVCGNYQQHSRVQKQKQEKQLRKAEKQKRQRKQKAVQDSKLDYDSWMYYFAVSLLWRHLMAHGDLSYPDLFVAALRMRRFLLEPSNKEEAVRVYALVPPFTPLKTSESCTLQILLPHL